MANAMDAAIDRYFEVKAEIVADLERRHEAHKARLAATGERIDRFLTLAEARKRQFGGGANV